MSKLNSFFNNYNYAPAQRLISDLIIESIKVFGVNAYYIPRNDETIDHIFGENPNVKFDQFTEIEVYAKADNGFEGQGRFLSKFGLEIRESMEFVVSARRFKEVCSNYLYDENNYVMFPEEFNPYQTMDTAGYLCEDGDLSNFDIKYDKPQAGDLLYIPLFGKYFEIMFRKDYNEVFYEIGQIPMYSLECELFEYSHEQFDTQNNDIDIVNIFNGNSLTYNMQAEDGSNILDENDGVIIIEDYEAENYDPSANNHLYVKEADNVIDFGEISPFISVNSDGKW